MRMRLEFEASDKAEVEYVLGILGQHSALVSLSGLGTFPEIGGGENIENPEYGDSDSDPIPQPDDLPTEKPARKRGRPKKLPEPTTNPVIDALPQGDVGTEAVPSVSDKPDDEPDMFAELTPSQQREKASKLLYELWSQGGKKNAITGLVKKYGVASIKDVPDAHAAELLADAMMLAAQVEPEGEAE